MAFNEEIESIFLRGAQEGMDRENRIRQSIADKAAERQRQAASESYSRHVEEAQKAGMRPLSQQEFEIQSQKAPISMPDIRKVEAMPDIVIPAPAGTLPGVPEERIETFTPENIQAAAEARPAEEAYQSYQESPEFLEQQPAEYVRKKTLESRNVAIENSRKFMEKEYQKEQAAADQMGATFEDYDSYIQRKASSGDKIAEIAAQEPYQEGFFEKAGDVYEDVSNMVGAIPRAMGDGKNIITGETFAQEKGREMLETESALRQADALETANQKMNYFKSKGGKLPDLDPEEADAWMQDQASVLGQAVEMSKQIITDDKTRNRFINDMLKFAPGDVVLGATGVGAASIAKRFANMAKATKTYQKAYALAAKNPKTASYVALAAKKAEWKNAYGALEEAMVKHPWLRQAVKEQGMDALAEVGLEHAETLRMGGRDQTLGETFVQEFAEGVVNPLTGTVTAARAAGRIAENRGRISPAEMETVKESFYAKEPRDVREAAKREDVAKIAPEIVKAQKSEKTKGLVEITRKKETVKDAKEYTKKGERTVRGSQGGDFDQVTVTGAGEKLDLNEELVHRAVSRADDKTRSSLASWEKDVQAAFEQKGEKLPFTGSELSAKKILFDSEGKTSTGEGDAVLAKLNMPKDLLKSVMEGEAVKSTQVDKKLSAAPASTFEKKFPKKEVEVSDFPDVLRGADKRPLFPDRSKEILARKELAYENLQKSNKLIKSMHKVTDSKKLRNWLSKSREVMVDTYFPLERLGKKVEEAGGKPGVDPSVPARLHPGVVGYKLDAVDKDIDPTLDIMARHKITQGELGAVLYTDIKPYVDQTVAYKNRDFRTQEANDTWDALEKKQAELADIQTELDAALNEGERDFLKIKDFDKKIEKIRDQEIPKLQEAWDKVEKVDPEKPGSGLSTETAKEWTAALEKDGKLGAAKKAAKRIQHLMQKVARDKWKGGLITKDEYKKFIAATQGKYVTLKHDQAGSLDASTIGVMKGKGFSTNVAEQARYGMIETADPRKIVPNTLSNAYKAQVDIARNQVAQDFYNYAEENPDPNLWEFDPDPGYKYIDDPETGMTRKVPTMAEKPHFDVMFDGELKRLYPNMDNPVVAAAMQSMTGENRMHPGLALRSMAAVHSYMKLVYTSLNVDFTLPNFFRDSMQASFNIGAEQSEKIAKETRKKLLSNLVFLGRQDVRVLPVQKGKKAQDSRQMLDLYKKSGGKTDFRGMEYAEYFENRFDKAKKKYDRSKPVALTKGAIENTLEFIGDVNNVVENVWRFSVFEAMVNNGVDPKEAAIYARKLTVDFNQRGASQTANFLWIFASVAFSSTERFMKVAAAHPAKTARMMGGLSSAALGLNFYNEAWGGETDDGEKYWHMIPDYEKDRHLIIMDPRGTGDYMKIPIPYIFSLSLTVANNIYDTGVGSKKWDEAAGAVLQEAVSSTMPIGGSNLEGVNYWLATFMPTLSLPVVYWAAGRDWRNMPLESGETQYTQKTAPYKYRTGTGKPFIAAAQAMQKLAGGDETHPSWADANPAVLEMIWDTFTGGVGTTGKRLFNLADAMQEAVIEGTDDSKEQLSKLKNYPIVRRFVGEAYTPKSYSILRELEDWMNYRRTDIRNTKKVHGDRSMYRRNAKNEEERERIQEQKSSFKRFNLSGVNVYGESMDVNLNRRLVSLFDRFKDINKSEFKKVDTEDEWSESRKNILRSRVVAFSRAAQQLMDIEKDIANLSADELGGRGHESLKSAAVKILNKYDEVSEKLIKKRDDLADKEGW